MCVAVVRGAWLGWCAPHPPAAVGGPTFSLETDTQQQQLLAVKKASGPLSSAGGGQ